MKEKRKLCLVSSGGGHWRELASLARLNERYDVFYATEEMTEQESERKERIYTFRQINRRERFFFPHFLRLFVFAWTVLRNERPEAVISTGALFTYPFCLLAKLMGIRVIYIESIARTTELSLTGRLIYPFADLFLVQWECLLSRYPKADYKGSLI